MLRLVIFAAALLTSVASEASVDSAFDHGIQGRFIAALNAVEVGKYGVAIAEFRRILASAPNLHRVRLELARTYFLARQWERSRQEFFIVLSADVPEKVRNSIRAFLRQIDERRGWSWDFYSGVIGGEGLTRRYHSDTILLNVGIPVEFEINRPKQPSWGVEYGGAIEFRKSLSAGQPTVTGRISAAIAGKEFPGAEADDYAVEMGSGVVLTYPNVTLDAGPVIARRWYAAAPFEDRVGMRAKVSWRILGVASIAVEASGYHSDSHLSDERDGALFSAEARLERSVGGRALVGIFGGYSDFRANASHESFDEWRAGVFVVADLGLGVTGALTSSAAWRKFDTVAPLFFEPERRFETRLGLRITKTNYFIGPFNPYAGLDVVRQDSNNGMNRFWDMGPRLGMAKSY